MARLFVTPREIDFFNDLAKELDKDITGQKIFYYRIREELSQVHEVYEESIDKVFDQPIEIECSVDWEPSTINTDRFGSEQRYKILVYLQQRDMLDKDIKVREGDYFSYGDVFYEITSIMPNTQIYGQIEHTMGLKLSGINARIGKINFRPLGPTVERHTDEDAVQRTFVQQRGFANNRLGETGDVRALQKKNVLDKPISGPAEVSPEGGNENESGIIDSSFYDET
jgi:hypothetical protein